MLAQFFPPDIGGEERHVLNLSTVLAARGHDMAVATQQLAGTPEYEVLPSGVRVHRFLSTTMRLPGLYSDAARPHHPPLPDPLVVRALRRIVDLEQPEVVHAHNWIVNSAVAVRRTGRGHRPFGLVLTLHDYSHVCATKRMMRDGLPCPGPSPRACLRCTAGHYGALRGGVTLAASTAMRPWKNRAVDHVVSVSNAVARGNGIDGIDVPSSVIPNFVPDDLLAASADSAGPAAGLLPDPGFLFFVGDLSQEKGLLTLLRAHADLGPERPPLLLAGRHHADTPERLPDDVHLLADLPHPVVLEAFRRCACAVLPSTWPDPCPTTVLEAMATGRPVITTSIGGMVDMVEPEVNGLLVPPADHHALRQAMSRVLDNPRLADRLGRAAMSGVAPFRATSVAERLEQVYQEVRTAVAVR
jgi:glycosyltransferase involved in cell wall biosynthesis